MIRHAVVDGLTPYIDRGHTITYDSGREFSDYEDTASDLDARIYFAHPYASWEHGLNENTNGLIRQYFPKDRDLKTVTKREIEKAMDKLNHRPRKSLGYRTPCEVFFNTLMSLLPKTYTGAENEFPYSNPRRWIHMTSDTLQRILYVEDEPDIQTVTRIALETVGGFTVKICSSGEEALQAAVGFAPDLLLLDVMMPGMDGPTTLHELRNLPELANTPAVFMTAKVQPQEIEQFKSFGALAVIAKPFDPMALSNQIAEIWQKRNEQ